MIDSIGIGFPSGEDVQIYPKLMVIDTASYSLLVLFKNFTSGTVVAKSGDTEYVIGDYSNDWNSSSFEDYNYILTLQNV